MLASKFRLTGKKNYQNVEKNGEVFQYTTFGLAIVSRGDVDPSRFGFIVSTKISKEATERNRVKRIMREAVRMLTSVSNSGYDIVFLAKPAIIRIPTSQIMKEVKTALEERKLIK